MLKVLEPETLLDVQSLRTRDPRLIAELIAEREATGADRYDETWDGVYVMNPLPNDEHQDIQLELAMIFRQVVGRGRGRAVRAGVNVSDREVGWTKNYRGPDVAVRLEGGLAKNWHTHWQGGPDFVVEIVSEGDSSHAKLPFYAQISVREVLIVDRDPWCLELYRLQQGQLLLVGRSTTNESQSLSSQVLPLDFRLISGDERPDIEVRRQGGEDLWLV